MDRESGKKRRVDDLDSSDNENDANNAVILYSLSLMRLDDVSNIPIRTLYVTPIKADVSDSFFQYFLKRTIFLIFDSINSQLFQLMVNFSIQFQSYR